MRPPEPLLAARALIDAAWDLLRYGEGISGLQAAWDRHVSALIGDENNDAQEAVFYACGHHQDYGYRAGLLVGYVAGGRGGSGLTAAEVARALVDAAEWQDAEAHDLIWPAEPLDGLEVASLPKMTQQERSDQQAILNALHTVRQAAEVAVVGDATAAATALWRSMNGVDLDTAVPEQMIELERLQQEAKLQARARLERILDANPPWWG